MGKITLSESQAVAELAGFFYEFLPWKPNPYADQTISFYGIAHRLGLQDFLSSGSKKPGIASLLENTLAYSPSKFCDLIEEIVRTSMKYPKKGEPTREEIETLNSLVRRCGFAVPALEDRTFLKGLRREVPATIDLAIHRGRLGAQLVAMDKLGEELQSRGYAFERFLNELFNVFELRPKSPFKLVGEQIDGSIELSAHTYLVEARWRKKQATGPDLGEFYWKIDGKAAWSRGLFISYGGFTKDGLEAFGRGRATNLIAMDGQDLYYVLQGKIGLKELIEEKARAAAEKGGCFVPVHQLVIV